MKICTNISEWHRDVARQVDIHEFFPRAFTEKTLLAVFRYAHLLFHIWDKKIKREKRYKKIFSPRDLIIPTARIEQKEKNERPISRKIWWSTQTSNEKIGEILGKKRKNLLESYSSGINPKREERKRGARNNRDRDRKFTVERISFPESSSSQTEPRINLSKHSRERSGGDRIFLSSICFRLSRYIHISHLAIYVHAFLNEFV